MDEPHRTVAAVVNGLRTSPLILALVVLVVISNVFNYWLFNNMVRSANERVQYLIEQLVVCQNREAR